MYRSRTLETDEKEHAIDFIAKDAKTIIFNEEVPIEILKEVQESLATLLAE